mmetsp:Transcript_50070/g.144214  ORF Transcript_50070/g.144214 Transcript_50070/m.144214 type:complete len:235 (-) Transcript_50070:51-755(-)
MQFVDLEGAKEPPAPAPAPHDQANLIGSGGGGGASASGGGGGAVALAAAGAAAGAARTSASALRDLFASAKNPKVCLFHVLFKCSAFLTYFLGRSLIGNYVLTFIVTVVLCAFDFWTVKNITGRLLVGMRWWNDIKEDGSSHWYFECVADESAIDPKDKSIFWGALYTWPVLWAVLLVLNFVSLSWDWLLLIAIALVFSASNVVGYWKCSKDQKRQMAEWAKSQAVRAVVSNWF